MNKNTLAEAAHDCRVAILRLAFLLAVGSAWMPIAQGQCWSESVQLVMSQPGQDDYFGSSVAISGDTAIVGAPGDENGNGGNAGSVHFFERDLGGANAWGKVTKKVVPNGDAGDNLGYSVAICDDTAVAGAIYSLSNASGAAYVYERDLGGPDAWGQSALLFAFDGESLDYFGASVGIDGDTIVVGAPWEEPDWQNPQSWGAAYVYERNQGGPNAWGEVIKLVPSDPVVEGEFGAGVTIQDDTIIVGAPGAEGASWDSGAFYVFERDLGGPNAWGELTKLWASDGGDDDFFGASLFLGGDTLIVGAPFDDNPSTDSGSAYIFEGNLGGPNVWGERVKLSPSFESYGIEFGRSVSVAGDIAVVGTPDDGPTGKGALFVFERHLGGPEAWGELVKLVPSDNGGAFGDASCISGTTALIGAWGAFVNNEPAAGAAYVFERGSEAVRYCTAGTSGSGCQALLMACGTPSATTPSGFVLSVESLEGSSHGVFYFGTNGRQANPWGNGTSFQCVVPPAHRAGVMKGVGTAGACDGAFSQDLNAHWCPTCPKPNHNPGAGAFVQAQLWYRDKLSTSNQPTSLSDAVEVQVGP